MAKTKPRGQRGPVGRVREKVARVGAIAKGRQPGAKSPVTLPASATPRIKPKGTAQMKNGGSQTVSRSRAVSAKAKAKSKRK